MIVMCEGCETSFNVDDRMIKPTGSKVRCSKCRHVFVAYPAAAAAETDEPLTLQDELTPAAAPGETAEMKEIDSQLDTLFNEKASGEGQAASPDEEPELLNMDDLLAEDAPAADPLTAEKLGDDLGLDLDLGLRLEEDSGKEAEPAKASPRTTTGAPAASAVEPSIDFSMDLEPATETPAEDSLPSLEELEINLDDLDRPDEAAQPATAAATPQADVPSGELELELDLGALTPEGVDAHAGDVAEEKPGARLEPPVAQAKTAAKPADEDELDLSDLEAMLEGEESPAASTRAATPALDLDLDLEAGAAVDAKSGEMQELDLTAIASATEKGPAPVAAPADELDFSDISGVLGEKTPATAQKGADKPAEDLDLVFDDEPSAAASAKPAAPSENQENLMLDIENLLEEGEEQKPAAAATEELDLDIAAGPARAQANDLEIEIEPVDDGLDTEAAVGRRGVSAASAGVAAVGVAAAAAVASAKPGKDTPSTDEFSTDEFTQAGMTGATDMLETEVAQKARPRAKKTKAPRRSWGRKLVTTTLGLLVLLIVALVIPRSIGIQIPYLSDFEIPYLKDLEIPYLGKIFQSEPEDTAGNLKIAPVSESLSAEFIDNAGAGRLCVIKGQVRNNYDHPRSFISVTAKLYAKNKTVAKTATVFAGNVLSNQELTAQDLAAITARLKNKTGVNNLNVGVKPGRSIPFIAVFDNLPGNLDEYSVEVAGSSK